MQVRCLKKSHIIKTGKRSEFIIIIIYHVRTTANVAAMTVNCYYYDRAVHISVAVDMRTLLDRKNFSSRTNGQVAARRVTGLIIKWFENPPPKFNDLYVFNLNVDMTSYVK